MSNTMCNHVRDTNVHFSLLFKPLHRARLHFSTMTSNGKVVFPGEVALQNDAYSLVPASRRNRAALYSLMRVKKPTGLTKRECSANKLEITQLFSQEIKPPSLYRSFQDGLYSEKKHKFAAKDGIMRICSLCSRSTSAGTGSRSFHTHENELKMYCLGGIKRYLNTSLRISFHSTCTAPIRNFREIPCLHRDGKSISNVPLNSSKKKLLSRANAPNFIPTRKKYLLSFPP